MRDTPPAASRSRSTDRLRCNRALEVTVLHTQKSRDWSAVIHRLNKSPVGEIRIRMGSPGSAQVTRCRLLAQWTNLEITTVGATLTLRLRP